MIICLFLERKKLEDNDILSSILNNASLIVLLNYFSVKYSLILTLNLDLLDVDEENISL